MYTPHLTTAFRPLRRVALNLTYIGLVNMWLAQRIGEAHGGAYLETKVVASHVKSAMQELVLRSLAEWR